MSPAFGVTGHAHRETAAARSRGVLVATLVLTGGYMLVELAGAFVTGSLALFADAAHMLTDVGGLVLALFAIWIAARPPTPEKTYGYYRAEILAALVNALLLLAVAGGILVEAYERLMHPRSVLVAAAVVLVTGWMPADALVSAGIALFIVPRTWRLLRQAVNVLLEGVPAHLDLTAIDEAMTQVAGVRRVHDLHVWTLTSGREAMSAHVVVDDVRESERLLDALHTVVHARFGIDHTTIQLETEPPAVLTIKAR